MNCRINRKLDLTFKFRQQPVTVVPLQLEDIETDEILKVHQNKHQRVELISQPEVRKLYAVKRSGKHTKLGTQVKRKE